MSDADNDPIRAELERLARVAMDQGLMLTTLADLLSKLMREAARRPACRVPQCTGVLRDVAPDARRPIFTCDVCGARDEWRCG